MMASIYWRRLSEIIVDANRSCMIISDRGLENVRQLFIDDSIGNGYYRARRIPIKRLLSVLLAEVLEYTLLAIEELE